MTDNQVSAAVLVIGNEILSGRTQDTNVKFIAEHLSDCGVVLAEVRIIEDVKEKIIETVNELRNKYSYLFTTGGIGPTHDDVTSESIAEAFSVELELREEAVSTIKRQYKEAQMTFEERSLKMAMIPKGAELIKNIISGAPGFRIDNVFVLAGVPHIMRKMFLNILDEIKTSSKFHSETLVLNVGESAIMDICRNLQVQEEDVQIGSYPFMLDDNRWATKIVVRSINLKRVKAVIDKLKKALDKNNVTYK